MRIKEVWARTILDSRGDYSIEVMVNGHKTSAPSGKSLGKYEKPAYKKSLRDDVEFVHKLRPTNFPIIRTFEDLEILEKEMKNHIGANTLFALEASILKALAHENNTSLWKFLNPLARIFPRILSNTVGGGAHSPGIKPDFQEFLVVCNKDPSIAKVVNKNCHEQAGRLLSNLSDTKKGLAKNDENAWQTEFDNELVLEIMKEVQEDVSEETGMAVGLGLDCAASQFFSKDKYTYRNKKKTRTSKEQIKYILDLAKKYNLTYIEDPLDEEDFEGFAEIMKNTNCMIVGDDLTVTNFERVQKAIDMQSINAVIIKPNQTGSLLEVKRIIDLCNRFGIRTIMSHRSGETFDDTIADLAFAWQCDFIKIPVIGREREIKVDRLIHIEQKMR